MTPDELVALTHRPGPGRHVATTLMDGRLVDTLADLPPLRNGLLFVGMNPSPASVDAGHHQQGELGRTFWRRLVIAGILPAETALETADDALVAAGTGITNLVSMPAEPGGVTDAALAAGVGPLWQKIAIWRPAAIMFIDKRAADTAAGRSLAEPWGQLVGVALAGRPCFLMPSPDAASESVDAGLNLLRNLAASIPADRS